MTCNCASDSCGPGESVTRWRPAATRAGDSKAVAAARPGRTNRQRSCCVQTVLSTDLNARLRHRKRAPAGRIAVVIGRMRLKWNSVLIREFQTLFESPTARQVGARGLTQIFNLPYRGFSIRKARTDLQALELFDTLPNTIRPACRAALGAGRRYGRLEICATIWPHLRFAASRFRTAIEPAFPSFCSGHKFIESFKAANSAAISGASTWSTLFCTAPLFSVLKHGIKIAQVSMFGI